MKISNEVKVGLMVVAAIVFLVFLTIKAGNFRFFQDGYTVKVYFKNIDGIDLNSPVMFNGFEIGIVKDIAIRETKDRTLIEVTLWIRDGIRLHKGIKAFVKNLGFMGEKYIGLISSEKDSGYLKSGDVIIGEDPPDFEGLLRDGKQIAVQLREITENINKRLKNNSKAIDEILANINDTTRNISLITDNIENRLRINKDNVDDILENLNAATHNLEEMTYDLKLHPWKLLHRGKEKLNK